MNKLSLVGGKRLFAAAFAVSAVAFAVTACSSGTNNGVGGPSVAPADDPTGAKRAPAGGGCAATAAGCVCSAPASGATCGRNQIPTDPDDFRKDLFFVTPCCASAGWPSAGSCTCENRVGTTCKEKDVNGKTVCECGAAHGGMNATGATEPSSDPDTVSSCSAPSGGKCCAIPGPNGSSPYVGCICGEGSSCSEIANATGAIEVSSCQGDDVLSPYCPSGTTELGLCHGEGGSSSSSSSSSSGSNGGCTANADCGSCERCELSTGTCRARLTC